MTYKISIYLASEIPVIVWLKSAMARFIIENNVGICIDSLSECQSIFENIKKDEYEKMVDNSRKISFKLRSGYYIKEALKTCENLVSIEYF